MQTSNEDQNLVTLSVLVENKFGVLARVANLFARRGYNIYSLAVAPTDDMKFSRITICYDANSATVEQVVKQLFKLINVIRIDELDPQTATERELLLAIVRADDNTRSKVMELVTIFEGKIVDVGHAALTVMLAGRPDKLDDFEELLRPYGITSLQRTGRVALPQLEHTAPRLRPVSNRAG
jgi:acetolactate synthase I/III small subunit